MFLTQFYIILSELIKNWIFSQFSFLFSQLSKSWQNLQFPSTLMMWIPQLSNLPKIFVLLIRLLVSFFSSIDSSTLSAQFHFFVSRTVFYHRFDFSFSWNCEATPAKEFCCHAAVHSGIVRSKANEPKLTLTPNAESRFGRSLFANTKNEIFLLRFRGEARCHSLGEQLKFFMEIATWHSESRICNMCSRHVRWYAQLGFTFVWFIRCSN